MNFSRTFVFATSLVALIALGFSSLGIAQSTSARFLNIESNQQAKSLDKKETTRPPRPALEIPTMPVSTSTTVSRKVDDFNWSTDEMQDLELLTKQEPTPSERRDPTADLMRPITEVSIDIRHSDKKIPFDRSVELQNYVTRDWTSFAMPELAFLWQSPDIRYQQLYFENVSLERYGQTVAPYRQVYRSGAHFFCSVVLLPYHMIVDPSKSCDTPLGYCRPGNNVPWVHQRQLFPR